MEKPLAIASYWPLILLRNEVGQVRAMAFGDLQALVGASAIHEDILELLIVLGDDGLNGALQRCAPLKLGVTMEIFIGGCPRKSV